MKKMKPFNRYITPGEKSNTQRFAGQSSKSSNTSGRSYGQKKDSHPRMLSLRDLDKMVNDMDSGRLLSGSSDLIENVQRYGFEGRLNELFSDVNARVKFMRVVVATVSTSQADVNYLRTEFLTNVLNSTLIGVIIDENVSPVVFRPPSGTAAHANLFDLLLALLINGFEILPTKMNALMGRVQTLVTSLNTLSGNREDFLSDATKLRLQKLEMMIEEHMDSEARAMGASSKAAPASCGRPFVESVGGPPNDFRTIPIIPRAEDINLREKPYLRAIKTEGAYASDEDYLDVQYRLLREDYLRPLREGIEQFHRVGGNNSKRTDLYVYRGVRIAPPKTEKQTGQVLHYASFNTHKKMRWDKRLKYGSLVCFSADNFQRSFVFGTVVDRELKLLAQGKVGLKIETTVNCGATYSMVESPAFFESYRHVMAALQSYQVGEQIPFSRYLVAVNVNTASPDYLNRALFRMNLRMAITPERRESFEDQFFDVREIRNRLHPLDLGMDISQFEAFCYALTTDMAIVQGPPGTGKTYMGLQIAKVLFDNITMWNPVGNRRPMLVVCYTNHALDQFLEGIAQFLKKGIVRVGGRSKNPAMDEFNLHNVRGTHSWVNIQLKYRYINSHKTCKDLGKKLQKINGIMNRVKHGVFFPEDFSNSDLHSMLAEEFAMNVYFLGEDYDFDKVEEFVKEEYCSAGINMSDSEVSSWLEMTTKPDICFNNSEVSSWLEMTSKPEMYFNGFEVFSWLENTSEPSIIQPSKPQRIEMNLPMVQMFIRDFGFSEIFAMNVAYECIRRDLHVYEDIIEFLDDPAIEHYINLRVPHDRLLPPIRHWPSLAQINYLMQQGFSYNLAYQMLTDEQRSANQVMAIHANWSKKDILDEQQLPDAFDEILYFNNDDQENNAMYDNVFDGIKAAEEDVDKAHLNMVSKMIRTASPMSENEVQQIVDIWKLPLQDRWRLCRYCLNKRSVALADAADKLETKLCEELRKYNELKSLANVDVMKGAKIVGMTTTCAARSQAALRSMRPPIVIVEEAAEVFEAHILSSLTRSCEHLILIGDHQQLRPSPASYELEKNYNFDVSLFERMINNQYPFRRLKKQHRMCPDISRTLMSHFYQDLEDHESVNSLPSTLGMQKNLFFMNHNSPETSNDEFKSHKNVFEAQFCVRLARYFLQQTYKADDLTILCTYLDQMKELRSLATKEFGADHGIRIESVDNYQGEESNIIILSLVRSNNPEKRIGFLSIDNRICVALSRARRGLYVIGNIDFLANNCSSDLWQDIRKRADDAGFLGNALPIKCQPHGHEQVICDPKEFDTKAPEGGCLQLCGFRKDCGHMCRKPCHAYDPAHTARNCTEACPRSCSNGHPCHLLCYQDCGNCMIEMDKQLPCLHRARAHCYMPVEEIACSVPCPKLLSCGHPCTANCGVPCDNRPCSVPCPKLLSCGHPCTATCSDSCDSRSCSAPCPKLLRCGHPCTENCSVPCNDEKCIVIVEKVIPRCDHTVSMRCCTSLDEHKCKKMVERRWPICGHTAMVECYRKDDDTICEKQCEDVLKKCGHACTGTCGECRNGRLHVLCNSNCRNVLICCHDCDGKCCEACPPCKKPCETACEHSQCGAVSVHGENLKEQRGSIFTRSAKGNRKGKQKGRLCGNACLPCAEPCLNACEHRQCSKRCGEVCDVEPCVEPCRELLSCSPKPLKDGFEGPLNRPHYCIGVCGEDCMTACRICDTEYYAMIQEHCFGTEKEEGARFTKLKDCGHILEVSGMDAYVASKVEQGGAIVPIDCPRCQTPIRRSKRYIAILNKNAENLEKIKLKIRGAPEKVLAEKFRQELLEANLAKSEVSSLSSTSAPKRASTSDWGLGDAVMKVSSALETMQQNVLSTNLLLTARNILKFLKRISEFGEFVRQKISSSPIVLRTNWETHRTVFEVLQRYDAVPVDGFLFRDLRDLTNRLDVNHFSDQFAEQFQMELDRFHFMFEVINWLNQLDGAMKDKEVVHLSEIFAAFHSPKEFQGSHKEKVEASFSKLKTTLFAPGYAVTEMELLNIQKAMSSHITNWFMCPNGHPYGIGDCGGAMQESKCADCGAPIKREPHI